MIFINHYSTQIRGLFGRASRDHVHSHPGGDGRGSTADVVQLTRPGNRHQILEAAKNGDDAGCDSGGESRRGASQARQPHAGPTRSTQEESLQARRMIHDGVLMLMGVNHGFCRDREIFWFVIIREREVNRTLRFF